MTATSFLAELILNSTTTNCWFGYYHVSSNKNVDISAAIWSDYTTVFQGQVDPIPVARAERIRFVAKNPADNYAECAGTYTKDSSRTVNKIPIYVNADNTRVIFSNIDGKWSITAAFYLPSMITDTISPKK